MVTKRLYSWRFLLTDPGQRSCQIHDRKDRAERRSEPDLGLWRPESRPRNGLQAGAYDGMVIAQGDAPGPMYVVAEGRLRCFTVDEQGRRRYLSFFRKGDYFGEHAPR